MESATHDFCELFKQLGLPHGRSEIDAFIARHRPLPSTQTLAEAEFWNAAQRAFLCQQWQRDADWAELIDQLDARLR